MSKFVFVIILISMMMVWDFDSRLDEQQWKYDVAETAGYPDG